MHFTNSNVVNGVCVCMCVCNVHVCVHAGIFIFYASIQHLDSGMKDSSRHFAITSISVPINELMPGHDQPHAQYLSKIKTKVQKLYRYHSDRAYVLSTTTTSAPMEAAASVSLLNATTLTNFFRCEKFWLGVQGPSFCQCSWNQRGTRDAVQPKNSILKCYIICHIRLFPQLSLLR